MPVPLEGHSAFEMELPNSKPQTLTMELLVKSFVMLIISLGLAWCVHFIYHRLFGN